MEVDEAAAVQILNTTANEVQPHNDHTATKHSPQNSATLKQRRQQQNRDSKSTTPQSVDESEEETNWPRLAVSSDEDEKELIHDKNSNKTISSEEDNLIAEEFCIKRKRFEVSRLGSEEILLGCDDETGEACLVSVNQEPAEIVAHNNMAERTKTAQAAAAAAKLTVESAQKEQQQNTDDETEAPAAKRLRKSPEKYSPTQEDKKPQKAVSQNNSASKTRSTSNGKQRTSTPTSKPMSAQDDFFKKPFEYGWKRELVWRATPESGRERADVYFISPAGKKIRTRHDILPLLQGDLTMDHFCWLREPVGMGPEFETVRNAKPNPNRASFYAITTTATPPTPVIGKRMPKPKGPKGASPPPEGWTPTRALKVNNAALNSKSGGFGSGFGGSIATTANRSVPSNASTRNSGNRKKPTPTSATTHALVGQPVSSGGVGGGNGIGITNNKLELTAKNDIQIQNDMKKTDVGSNRSSCEPCTIMCSRAHGLVPKLQCTKCLCLYHHQCVGLSPFSTIYKRVEGGGGLDYVCEVILNLNKMKYMPEN